MPAGSRRYVDNISKRSRGYLPHWEREGGAYFLTFRLADSLPKAVADSIEFERSDIVKIAERRGRPLTPAERKRLAKLFSERVERFLDRGAGGCSLSDPRIARAVVEALQRFDGDRYRLLAWCVMPNHVHVVVEVFRGSTLPRILHSWKSFTAKKANAFLRKSGVFWQREYYDRLLRDGRELDRAVRYVLGNPERAGLRNWEWVWPRT